MNSRKRLAIVAIATSALFVSASPAFAESINGSGATFALPLIDACKADFSKDKGHTVNYPGGGSGKGRTDFASNLVDFAGSDAPYSSGAPANLVYAPIYAAPIAVMYKIGNDKPLYLSPATIAGIFGGKITKWNDPLIKADNNREVKETIFKTDGKGQDVKDKNGKPIVLREVTRKIRYTLPNKPIKVIYRSDSSGTNGNFTAALNGAAPEVWTKAGNNSFTTTFPGNINDVANLGRVVGAASSTGVAQLAGKTPYSITYAEVNYAAANKLKIANLINPAGSSVAPDSTGVGAFLASASQDANGFLTYDYATKEKGAYPLGIVSYLLADTKYPDAAKAKAVKEFATYILSTKCSKDVGGALGFSVIDGELLKKSLAQVAKIG